MPFGFLAVDFTFLRSNQPDWSVLGSGTTVRMRKPAHAAMEDAVNMFETAQKFLDSAAPRCQSLVRLRTVARVRSPSRP